MDEKLIKNLKEFAGKTDERAQALKRAQVLINNISRSKYISPSKQGMAEALFQSCIELVYMVGDSNGLVHSLLDQYSNSKGGSNG